MRNKHFVHYFNENSIPLLIQVQELHVEFNYLMTKVFKLFFKNGQYIFIFNIKYYFILNILKNNYFNTNLKNYIIFLLNPQLARYLLNGSKAKQLI